MLVEEFKLRGCYVCGLSTPDLFVQPRIATDEDTGIPVREPYLLCMNCSAEYNYSDIDLLDEESWEYGRRRREGALAIPNIYYKSETQFSEKALEQGFLTKEQEDVERPG